ncbi:hypothetical protein [Streptomyces sp. H39-C1]|uniref:hypothetical protein n=1 Tax=Streptomyces sp. H39-C1 TaxID=3004355 RepID=UPI0022AFD2C0|nr:hypothetical protein [Streptomyces sp. H39-C1]MCZ4103536.1 hypothetical protein [Streptomyces sp. H39-C1]
MTTPSRDGQHAAPPPTAPEQLLELAGDFSRHNDALTALTATGPSATSNVLQHVAFTQCLARETLTAIAVIKRQPLHHTHQVQDALVRLKQLAYLTTEAADHLLDAVDLMRAAREQGAGSPDQLAAHPEPLRAAFRRIQLARELTALAPEAVVEAAEHIARESHRQKAAEPHPQEIRLSLAQYTALRAAASGHVLATDLFGKQSASIRSTRIPISTLRSLQAKHLLQHEMLPPAHRDAAHQSRIRLSPAGVAALAALRSWPRPAPLITKGALHPAPAKPAPSRAR